MTIVESAQLLREALEVLGREGLCARVGRQIELCQRRPRRVEGAGDGELERAGKGLASMSEGVAHEPAYRRLRCQSDPPQLDDGGLDPRAGAEDCRVNRADQAHLRGTLDQDARCAIAARP